MIAFLASPRSSYHHRSDRDGRRGLHRAMIRAWPARRGSDESRAAGGGPRAVRGRGHRLPRPGARARPGSHRRLARSARPTSSTGAATCSRSRRRSSVTRRWARSSRSAPDVENIKVGDRVIVPGTSECGVCFYCSIGRPDQCSETFDRGGIWPHVANRRSGEPVSAAGNVGGYAEVMNVTAHQVFPVQTDLPDEWLSLLGCGITTGVGQRAQRRQGAGRLVGRDLRSRPPRAMDGAGGADRQRRARSSPSTRSPSAASWPGGSAPPTSSTPRTAIPWNRSRRSPADAARTTRWRRRRWRRSTR